MKFLFLLSFYFLSAQSQADQVIRYDNWQAWNIFTQLNATQQQNLNAIITNSGGEVKMFFNRLLVHPRWVPEFLKMQAQNSIPSELAWLNFQE